jgi:hypothetical protein
VPADQAITTSWCQPNLRDGRESMGDRHPMDTTAILGILIVSICV